MLINFIFDVIKRIGETLQKEDSQMDFYGHVP